jgi:Peptidase A4 family
MNTLTRRLAQAAAAACTLIPLATAAAPAQASMTVRTGNWAGYIIAAPAGQHVNSVYAEWTVPTARPAHSVGKPPYQASMWVGIDGSKFFGQKYGPFQTGLWELTNARNKPAQYVLFWEMVPDGIQLLRDHYGHVVHPKPGDHITARVSWGTQPQYKYSYHKLHFAVTVNGQLFETYQAPRAGWRVDRHTAEVMSEANSVGSTQNVPGMLDMGTVHYQHAMYAWDNNSLHPVTAVRFEFWRGGTPILQTTGTAKSPGWQYGPDKFTTLVTGRW